jgi:membrane protease YdiL (CAAX protease family)
MLNLVGPATGARRVPSATMAWLRPLVTYLLLAYGLSWAWLVPLVVRGARVTAGHGWPTHLPALLGPMIAAIALSAFYGGRSGLATLLRRMVGFKAPIRWWVFALSPLFVLGAVLLLDVLTGRSGPAVAEFAMFGGVPSRWGALGVALILLVVNGFGEETGWRGYALPRLQQRFRPLTATLVVALCWAAWHLPMFFVVDTFRAFTPPLVVGWFIGIFSGSVVLSWLYNRSGSSILLVAVWHTTYNLISGTDAATGLLAALSTTLVIVLACVLVVLQLRAERQHRPGVLRPAP